MSPEYGVTVRIRSLIPLRVALIAEVLLGLATTAWRR